MQASGLFLGTGRAGHLYFGRTSLGLRWGNACDSLRLDIGQPTGADAIDTGEVIYRLPRPAVDDRLRSHWPNVNYQLQLLQRGGVEIDCSFLSAALRQLRIT